MRSEHAVLLLSGVLCAGPAAAGVAVEMVRSDVATGQESPADHFYVHETMLKIEPGEAEENLEVIFRDDSLYLINHDDQTYQRITGEQIRGLAERIGPMLEQMRAQLKNLPAEQREQLEKMMLERMGIGSLERPQIDMRQTSRQREVDGRACVIWEMVVNDERTHEMCLADTESVEGGTELVAALRAMAEFQKGILDSLGMQAGTDNPFMNMIELDGVPVETITFEGDEPLERVRLAGADERSFDDQDFLPPQDYELIESDIP